MPRVNRDASGIVMIEYPGIVKNPQKAIKTLGGIQKISDAHFSGRQLELKYTEGCQYANALVSEIKDDDAVNQRYTFESLADFQYLPLKKHSSGEGFEDITHRLIPTTLSDSLSWWDRQEAGSVPLFLPPYQFSRYTQPSQKILIKESEYSLQKIKRLASANGSGKNMRLERKVLSQTVQAFDVFPSEPTQDAMDDTRNRVKCAEFHTTIKNLFEERPMWTRIAIQQKTGLEDSLLRVLLQAYAFYILSGPWGRLWCRFGYDPKVDPESRRYQTVMVTFRKNLKIPERQRLKVNHAKTMNDGHQKDYIYYPGVLPSIRQIWFCVMDIVLPLAEQALKETPISRPAEEVALTGWITQDLVDQIRESIKENVQNTIEELETGEIFDDAD